MDPFDLIIAVSAVIIVSFFFNILAKRTNIPSVLMLIVLGVVIKESISATSFQTHSFDYFEILKVLGNVGLVMIVLEAALDLELNMEKKPMIIKSFLVALISLALSTLMISAIIFYLIPGVQEYFNAIVYAIPLSIMSSAFIIPSVAGLKGEKKEFMVYESTFSDILGIMVFYFVVGQENGAAVHNITLNILLNILVTVVISVVVAYGLVYLFQKLSSQVKLFLIIAVLMFMFAVGKKFHLSSLLIILAFGLVLNNTSVFFKGRLSKYLNQESVKPILHDFHILTLESAFVIRTFFFVIFGMFITISSLIDLNVALVSICIITSLYVVRFVVLRVILKTDNLTPLLWIAPRGLITILLFFALNESQYTIDNFDPGILLFTILISSLIMTIALITYRGEKVSDVLFSSIPKFKTDKNKDGIHDDYEDTINENVDNQKLRN